MLCDFSFKMFIYLYLFVKQRLFLEQVLLGEIRGDQIYNTALSVHYGDTTPSRPSADIYNILPIVLLTFNKIVIVIFLSDQHFIKRLKV